MRDEMMTLGTGPDGDLIQLPTSALLRHMVALGSSGSGKTILCKVIVEEAVRKGVPAIVVDPQGDLASLGLMGDPEALIKMGVDPFIAHEYHQLVDVKIWTPGSSQGIPVNVSPPLRTGNIERLEDRMRAWANVGNSLAEMAGYGGAASECARVAFSTILEYADDNRLAIDDLNDFSDFLRDPPRALADRLEPIFDQKARTAAEKRFRVKMMGSNRLLFDLGKPIHIDSMFGYEDGGAYDNGKVRVSVVYLNTLNSFEEKSMFVANLCNSLYQWMLLEAKTRPHGLFYMDEVAPYMPPVRKPVSKDALMLLLRQARKYGICMLLATQSPGDLDYKGLSQVGTWALGRIATGQEIAKVAPALRADADVDVGEIMERLPGYPAGRFALINASHFDGPQEMDVRWLVSNHKVLSPEDVESITNECDRENFG